MKRSPQCNRVETDEALKFCRLDGATLVSDSGSISDDAGTAIFGSAPTPNETETSILTRRTDTTINRETAPTTVLPAQPTGASSALTKPKRRTASIAIGVIFTAIVAAVTTFVVDTYLSRKSGNAIESIAVMPFVNESGNTDVEFVSDGMTETLITSPGCEMLLEGKPKLF